MTKRIVTAIVALALFVPVLYFSGTWVYPAAVALLSVVAVYEMLGCIGVRASLFLFFHRRCWLPLRRCCRVPARPRCIRCISFTGCICCLHRCCSIIKPISPRFPRPRLLCCL